MTTKNDLSYVYQQELLLMEFFNSLGVLDPYAEILRHEGLKSFDAWGEFEAECCDDDVEYARLPHYVRERARALFTRPGRFLGKELSEYLATLRPWENRYDVDPGRDRLSELQELRMKRCAAYRQAEFESWAQENQLTEKCFDSYIEFFSSMLVWAFSKNGFYFDEKKSKKGIPVVSKPLIEGWNICWSVEQRKTLIEWPRPTTNNVWAWSSFELYCYVYPQRTSRRVTQLIGSKLVLGIDELVNGFRWAYLRINGKEQLSFCLSAYSKLYSALENDITNKFAPLLSQI